MFPRHVFREYDIRGVADRDLDDAFAHALGRGLGTVLGPGKRIALGRDCRLSSPRLHASLLAGLERVGVRVVDIGVVPTPMLYFAVHHLATDGGVMITGSHNPPEDNGFKIMRGKASFFGADIQTLRALVEEERFAPDATGSHEDADVLPAYVETVRSGIRIPSPEKLRVVVDAGNGAGGPAALAVMHAAGLRPEALYCDMDGRFPNHHPDPTVPANVAALVERVRATGARVGIAYDGDADRLGAVDADGEIVWGDKLMILFSRALLAERPGAAILGEVKCSQTLYDDIALHGGTPILWKTGHSLIKTKMKESGALLAGEMSGHLFFADRYFGYDDAVYAAARLIELLSRSDQTLADLVDTLPVLYNTPELRVPCPEEIKFEVVERAVAHYKARHPVVDVDGARVQFPGGWGLVRASNTGPILVLRCEADSPERLASIRGEIEERLRLITAEVTGG